jgi:hypothetical protein
MLGAGTVINPIIKIVTTVVILAAAYLFIVKPVLDTTEKSFDTFGESFDGFDELPGQIQSQVDDALGQANGSKRLQDCIERAIGGGGSPNGQQIDRCINRFGP